MPLKEAARLNCGILAVPRLGQGTGLESAAQRRAVLEAFEAWAAGPHARLIEAEVLVDGARDGDVRLDANADGLPVGEVLVDWRRRHDIPARHGALRAWPMWSALGEGMAAGIWPTDVVRVAVRNDDPHWQLLSGVPSRTELVAHVQAWPFPVDDDVLEQPVAKRKSGALGSGEGASWERRGTGKFPAYDPRYMIAAVRASESLSRLEALPQQAQAVEDMLRPDSAEVRDALRRGEVELPSRWALLRARTRIDIARMLVLRREHRLQAQRQVVRYLTFDASPQGGVEISCVRQLVVRGGQRGEWEDLPMSTLGAGCCSTGDKCVALVHSAFCVAGPSASDIRRFFGEVRWTLTDAGAEQGICDYPDVVDMYPLRVCAAHC
jgi:hypothetical protein